MARKYVKIYHQRAQTKMVVFLREEIDYHNKYIFNEHFSDIEKHVLWKYACKET